MNHEGIFALLREYTGKKR